MVRVYVMNGVRSFTWLLCELGLVLRNFELISKHSKLIPCLFFVYVRSSLYLFMEHLRVAMVRNAEEEKLLSHTIPQKYKLICCITHMTRVNIKKKQRFGLIFVYSQNIQEIPR